MMSLTGLLFATLLGFSSCQGEAGETGATSHLSSGRGPNASVSGTVTYREKLALTPGATVIMKLRIMKLRDVSYADAPAPLIASQTISNPGQVPIKFELGARQYRPKDPCMQPHATGV